MCWLVCHTRISNKLKNTHFIRGMFCATYTYHVFISLLAGEREGADRLASRLVICLSCGYF